MEKDRIGEYVVELYRDGSPYAKRSLSCGPKTFKDAVAQWKRNGFTVKVIQQPA